MEAEGKLDCRCPDRQERPADDLSEDAAQPGDAPSDRGTCDSEDRYEAEITPEGIRVTCRRCGATALVPTGSMVSAHEFLTADSLRLE